MSTAPTVSNPVNITVPSDAVFYINGQTNAAWNQRVTIRNGNDVLAVFTGVGEGVPMSQNGENFYQSTTAATPITLNIFFEFQTRGPAWNAAEDCTVNNTQLSPFLSQYMIGSEDGGGTDYNDSLMTVTISLQ
jgi:hypothetical protein